VTANAKDCASEPIIEGQPDTTDVPPEVRYAMRILKESHVITRVFRSLWRRCVTGDVWDAMGCKRITSPAIEKEQAADRNSPAT